MWVKGTSASTYLVLIQVDMTQPYNYYTVQDMHKKNEVKQNSAGRSEMNDNEPLTTNFQRTSLQK
jgi:hypothetical protein